jgi:adenosyl cobinamide kinase/adenosyl cobinamide phosphate guanylyltransferase
MKTLILRGVRSGKSRLAESLAKNSGQSAVVIAKATAGDDSDMARRIDAHRAQRAGVAAEAVSAFPQSVTAEMIHNFTSPTRRRPAR